MIKLISVLPAGIIIVAYTSDCLASEYLMIERGKHGPIVFAIGVSGEGEILYVKILRDRERMGSKAVRKRFLRQFKGRRMTDNLAIGKDLHAITGATVSSKAATRAIRKALIRVKSIGSCHPERSEGSARKACLDSSSSLRSSSE